MIRFLKSVIAITIGSTSYLTANEGCSSYLLEAYARSGVVPRISDEGKVDALFLYGEGSFMAPTSNLVSSARTKAEQEAKRSLAEWLGADIDSETLSKQTMSEATITTNDGITEGAVNEFTSLIQSMRSQTKQTLQGIVKLDECMDPEMGVVLVTMGWKPSRLRVSIETDELTSNAGTDQQYSEPKITGSISIKSLTVKGFGKSDKDAIRDGLRMAVSQVFGEDFSSHVTTTGVTLEMYINDNIIGMDSTSAQTVSSSTSTASTTNGIVKSYQIINTEKRSGEIVVTLEVELPFYEANSRDNRAKVVVLPPVKMGSTVSDNLFHEFSTLMHRELEGILNLTNALSVLDRTSTEKLDEELTRMSGQEYRAVEYARVGNRLGADFLILTEVTNLNSEKSNTVLSEIQIDRRSMTSTVWVKVVEVATGNLIFSQRVPLKLMIHDKKDSFEIFVIRHAQVVGLTLAKMIGGGLTDTAMATLDAHRNIVDEFTEVTERLKDSRAAITNKIVDEW